jgi:hypothetical protein
MVGAVVASGIRAQAGMSPTLSQPLGSCSRAAADPVILSGHSVVQPGACAAARPAMTQMDARQWHRQRGISVGIERADAVAMSSWRAMLCPPRAG